MPLASGTRLGPYVVEAPLGACGLAVPEAVDLGRQIARGLAAAWLPADLRSDIFSMGIILYEMLTGQRAFSRGSPAETHAAILRDPPPLPGRPIPRELDRVVRRCLAKAPEERFPSARELLFALEAAGEAPLEALESCLERGWGNPEWIAQDADFDGLRDDPRFQAIVRRPARS
jgi:serine/threonine protein kinase